MEQIGRYRIAGELGRGAMGIVYRAQDPTIGRTVAIKTIRLGEVTDPKERERLRERLFREAQSAGALSHPNIVTIYDVAEEGSIAFWPRANFPPDSSFSRSCGRRRPPSTTRTTMESSIATSSLRTS
jgi:serine/threonine protein kinase